MKQETQISLRSRGPGIDEEAEVLVVGAGPVGLFTALLLTERGFAVRIIDEERRPAARSYALALHPGTLALFDEVGLADDLIALGHRLEGLAFYDRRERQARVSFARLPGPFPFVLVLPQQVLEGVLVGRLQEKGVEVEWNHRLSSLHVANARAAIERLSRNAEGKPAIEAEAWCQPRWVIGADGPHSVVRKSLGAEYAEMGPAETWAVFEISADLPAENEARVILEESGDGVFWPIARGRFRWSFRLADGESFVEPRRKSRLFKRLSEEPLSALVEEELRELLAQHAPWFEARIGRVVWSAAARFEHRLASRFGRGNVWLAGDAAHLMGPIGAQSMNVGLREAHDLASRLAAIAQGKGRRESLLESYARERQSEWRGLFGCLGPPLASAETRPWVERWAARLPASLPASGDDLAALLGQLRLAPVTTAA